MLERRSAAHPGRHPSAAWCALTLVLAVPALALGWAPLDPNVAHLHHADPLHAALLWTRATAWSQPWRCWTAVWVHGSALHLLGNLLGALLVALLGVAARVPPRFALAWAFAWPLTQLSLLLDSRLLAYGGLSGVLHAGVAVTAVSLLPQARVRPLGWALLAGLLLKIGVEAPWHAATVESPLLGIAVAPLAHLTGVVWGAVSGALALRLGPSSPGRSA